MLLILRKGTMMHWYVNIPLFLQFSSILLLFFHYNIVLIYLILNIYYLVIQKYHCNVIYQ